MLALIALQTALSQTVVEPETFTVTLTATVVRDPRPAFRPVAEPADTEEESVALEGPLPMLPPPVLAASVWVKESVVSLEATPEVHTTVCSDGWADVVVQLAAVESSGRVSRTDVSAVVGERPCATIETPLYAVADSNGLVVLGRVGSLGRNEAFRVISEARVL